MSDKFTKTAVELNMKVGDKFIAGDNNGSFRKGTTVTLVEDDGSRCPRFESESGKRSFAYAEAMTPLKTEPVAVHVNLNGNSTTIVVQRNLTADEVAAVLKAIN